MQPNDSPQNQDHMRHRMRKYDAYDPARLYVRAAAPTYQQSTASYTPPHDVRSGYVPPQSAAWQPEPVQPEQSYQQYVPMSQPPDWSQAPQDGYQNGPPLQLSQAAPAQPLPTVERFAPPKKQKSGGLFSSVVSASVRVDQVTRKSVKAIKHTFEPPQIAALRSKRQKLFLRSFYAAAALSMFASAYIGVRALLFQEQQKPVASTSVGVLGAQTNTTNDAMRDSEIPSENVPTSQDMKTYLVAPPYPRYLRIQSMTIDARIRRLGLDASGAVGTPNNIHDAGWYDSSVKPGDKDGVSLIVAHLSGPTKHGLFWDINKIAIGSKIEIEKGNGEVVHYKVDKIESVKKDVFNIANFLKSEVPGRNELRLVSSTGKYDAVSAQAADRYVVFATQTL